MYNVESVFFTYRIAVVRSKQPKTKPSFNVFRWYIAGTAFFSACYYKCSIHSRTLTTPHVTKYVKNNNIS